LKELDRELTELQTLERDKSDYIIKIQEYEKEIKMLDQCYGFVFELLPEERQREVEEQTKIIEANTPCGAKVPSKPELNIDQDKDALITEYKRVYNDIQDYLINTDEVVEKINNIDGNTKEQEDEYNERLEKQKVMHEKKKAFHETHVTTIENKDSQPKESETKF